MFTLTAIKFLSQTGCILFGKNNKIQLVLNALKIMENWKKSGIFTLINLNIFNFIALLMKRALKWYIFH